MVEHKIEMRNSRPPSPTDNLEAQDSLEAQRKKQDKALDEALELTFPASDPIAVSPGAPQNSGLSWLNRPFRLPASQLLSPCSVEREKPA